MGGFQFEYPKVSNVLSSLSSTGKFTRLHPRGDVPVPTFNHGSWSFDGKIYFFAGIKKEADNEKRKHMVAMNVDPTLFYNNDLHCLDLATNSYFSIPTTGNAPTPRYDFGQAQIGEKVFIHGGSCNSQPLNGFHWLNLHTFQWTGIQNTGFHEGIRSHTLIPISEKDIVLVGGDNGTRISNKVKKFRDYAYDYGWTELGPLADEVMENAGLLGHSAIHVPNEDGVFILCFGGYVDKPPKKHPNVMALLKIY